MEKENQRVKLTKLLLKNKLEELLVTKPINRITVKEICEQSGINRSTFYQHYHDQYDLLDDIELDIIKDTDEYISRISPEKSGRQYLISLLKYIRENSAILSVLLNPQSDTAFQTRFMSSVMKKLGTLHPVFLSSGLSPYFSQFILMGNISIIQQWIKSGFDLPDKKVADIIFNLSDSAVQVFGSLK